MGCDGPPHSQPGITSVVRIEYGELFFFGETGHVLSISIFRLDNLKNAYRRRTQISPEYS